MRQRPRRPRAFRRPPRLDDRAIRDAPWRPDREERACGLPFALRLADLADDLLAFGLALTGTAEARERMRITAIDVARVLSRGIVTGIMLLNYHPT